MWCETIKIVPRNPRDFLATNSDETLGALRFGIFYYSQLEDVTIQSAGDTFLQVTKQCVDYESGTSIDAAWKAARAFAIIAPAVAGLLTLNLYMAPCCIFFTRKTWSTLAFFFFLILPGLQGLTLLFLISNACASNPLLSLDGILSAVQSLRNVTTTVSTTTNVTTTGESVSSSSDPLVCLMDWGTYANIVSMILFCVTGIVMMIMGPPTRPPPKEPELHTVTYQQTTNEQGEPIVQEINTEVTVVKGKNPAWSSVSQPATIPTTDTNNAASANDDAGPWEQAKPY
jgi:hypothetical protein